MVAVEETVIITEAAIYSKVFEEEGVEGMEGDVVCHAMALWFEDERRREKESRGSKHLAKHGLGPHDDGVQLPSPQPSFDLTTAAFVHISPWQHRQRNTRTGSSSPSSATRFVSHMSLAAAFHRN